MNQFIRIITVTAVCALCHMYGSAQQPVLKQTLQLPDSQCRQLAIEARCAFHHTHRPATRQQSWRLIWDETDSITYRWAELVWDTNGHIEGIDNHKVTLLVGETTGDIETVTHRSILKSGIDIDGGFNSLLVEWLNGQTRIFAGNRGLQLIFDIPSASAPKGVCGISSHSDIEIQDLTMEWEPLKSAALQTDLTMDGIMQLATAQAGKPTGIWEFLDRENDPSRARPGGRYTLAVIESNTPGLFHIIYIDGAQINADGWHTGMLKGSLRSTPFEGHYTLTWYDALMEPIENDLNADMPNNSLLALNFPLMQTTLRFARRQ